MAKRDDPCIKVCRYDPAGLCLGCHRTKAEVKGWKRLDAPQRAAILTRIAPLMAGGGGAPKKLRKLDRKIAKLSRKLDRLRAERGELAGVGKADPTT